VDPAAIKLQRLSSKRKNAADAAASLKSKTPDKVPQGPLQVIISVKKQRLTLYANGQPIAHSPVSTGVPGHPTPMGVFSVIEKQIYHESNLYSSAPMPYMQRITWSGVAMHQGVVPGHPASHGCIRLPREFAQRLWRITKVGARVIIAQDEATSPISQARACLPERHLTSMPLCRQRPRRSASRPRAPCRTSPEGCDRRKQTSRDAG